MGRGRGEGSEGRGEGGGTVADRLGCVQCGRQWPQGGAASGEGKAQRQHAPVNDNSFEPSRPRSAPSIALASSRRRSAARAAIHLRGGTAGSALEMRGRCTSSWLERTLVGG